jgi:hypothetical protein
MMETVTLRGADFSKLHNSLCVLRNICDRSSDSLARELNPVIHAMEQALEDAYDQDETAFDRKMEYYTEFKRENGLRAIWSIYELEEHGFLYNHPWEGASVLVYGRNTVKIQGPTWADLYRAADIAIEESGDDHHCFIEGFGKYATDNSMLELRTGS